MESDGESCEVPIWKDNPIIWGSHPANNAGFSDGSFGMLNGKQKKNWPQVL
jgi:hypothetical protein